MRAILDGEVPSDADRVAVALATGPSPPHMVVSRGGRFVTCLAAGMTLDDTPVVPRERVEVHLRRADLHAERDRRAREVIASGTGVVRRLVARVRDAGSRLTREEVEQLVHAEDTVGRARQRWHRPRSVRRLGRDRLHSVFVTPVVHDEFQGIRLTATSTRR